MTNNIEDKGWEKEWEDKFGGLWLDGMIDYETDTTYSEGETLDMIKSFIKSLLTKQKEEIGEKVVELAKRNKDWVHFLDILTLLEDK